MNCCNHKNMPRPVRGNAFNVAVTVVARRIDGTVIDDFALTSEAVLKITHGTSSVDKEYAIIGQNVAVIHFDGTDAAGIYGVEFTGEWNGDPWRFAVPVVFQVVELTTQGWLPQDGIIYEPTYEVDAEIVIAGGGGGGDVQADWTETDPDSPAYILHKPADILEGTEIIACNITAVDNNHEATVDNTNWVNDAVAAYNAKKIPVLFGSVSSGVCYAMPLVVQPYETDDMSDYKVYGSAAVNIYIGSGQFKQSILYAQSQTTHGGHSIYVTDFQDTLVSGQNIKTINGNSLVGGGNVTIPTGLSVAYEVVDAGLLYLDQTETYYEVPASVYTALKTVWDAGKVPVLIGGLMSHTTSFALIPTYLADWFVCFYHGYNPMQGGIRWHLSGVLRANSVGQLYPEEEQKPITVDQTVIAGSPNPVSSVGVKTYVDNALAGKQDTLTFDSAPLENSTKPVYGGGIYSALKFKEDIPPIVDMTDSYSTETLTASVNTSNGLCTLSADPSAWAGDSNLSLGYTNPTTNKKEYRIVQYDYSNKQFTLPAYALGTSGTETISVTFYPRSIAYISGNYKAGRLYTFDTIVDTFSSITLAAGEIATVANHYMIQFYYPPKDAGSSVTVGFNTSAAFPDGVKWMYGEPTFKPDNTYLVHFMNGLAWAETTASGAGTAQQVHTNEVAATLDSEKVHIFAGTTDTLAVTLTAPTDALSHLYTLILTTGTTPAVSIQVSDSTAIIYPDDYAIEAGTTYEISVLVANGKYYLRYVNYVEP